MEEGVVLTPSRRQLRRREAGWEGSPRRNPAPRNTNRVGGWAVWVSLLKKAKPVTINRGRHVDAAGVGGNWSFLSGEICPGVGCAVVAPRRRPAPQGGG